MTIALAFNFNADRRRTRLTRLVVQGAPERATVTARCSRGCHSLSVTARRAAVSLKPLLRKPLTAGTRITVTVSKPGYASAVKVLTIRARKAPAVTDGRAAN
jgi:hypothetical protein